jgi:electron transport complex protein RnfE
MGIGFTLGIALIAVFRELLGFGSILGFAIIPETYQLAVLSGPAGAFLVYGLLVGQILKIQKKREEKREKAEVTI